MATEGSYDVTVLASDITDLTDAMERAKIDAPQIPQPGVLQCTGRGCPGGGQTSLQIANGGNILTSGGANLNTLIVYRFASEADAIVWKNYFSTGSNNVLGNKTVLQ